MLFRESGESPRVYLVATDHEARAAAGWFAFLLAAGTSGPPWGAVQPGDTLAMAGFYVTCPRPPASLSAFVEEATKVLDAFVQRRGVGQRSASWFTWFSDPDASGDGMGLEVLSVSRQGDHFVTDTVSPNVTVRDVVLSITAGAGVTYDGKAAAFALFAGAGLEFTVGGQGHTVGRMDQSLALPISGPQRGCVLGSCDVSRWSEFDLIAPSASFYAPGSGTALRHLRFPLFAGSAIGDDGVSLDVALDPSTPEAPGRTGLAFQGSPALPSFLRTVMGETVTLAPQGRDTRIGFANCPQRLDGGVAQPAGLTPYPAGPFTVGVPPGGGGTTARLVFGLSGTEFFEAPAGSVLAFAGGQPALVPFALEDAGAAPAGGALLTSGGGGATTAWARLSAGEAGATYHAQPQGAPLFAAPAAQGGAGDVTLLEPQVTTAWSGAEAPLVPVVAYASAAGTGDASELVALEQRAVALTRQRALVAAGRAARAALPLRVRPRSSERVWSTDHRGFRVGLDGGRPSAVTLASTPATAGGEPVDLTLEIAQPVVAEALLGEQVFLVATTTVDARGKPLFSFDGSLGLAGWEAEPGLASDWDEHAAVDTTTPMMIVKLGAKTVAGLAASLDEWTDPDAFLPQPAETQAALHALIEAAVDATGGDGAGTVGEPTGEAALFADFVRVVTDPGWTGVLFLNAGIGQAPPVIRGVLGGVPAKDLRWHHAGVSFSRVAAEGALPLRGSATFGLVDYVSDDTPSLEGASYTFWTRWLQALFLNSALASFNCRVALGLASFFGVPLALPADGDGGGGTGKPVIEINGVYQERGDGGAGAGTGVYSFVTTEHHTFDFDYSAATSLVTAEILRSITLTKVQLGPGGATSERITSDFAFWGTLAFGRIVKGATHAGLDVFNYDALPFGGLVLAMSAPAGGGPPDSWTIETGDATFDLGSATLRPGGLVGSLPLQLRGLRYTGGEPSGLDALGYLPLGLPPGNPDQASAVPAALVYSVDLGRPGTLGGAEPIVASVLTGWTASGGVLLGISVPGLGSDGSLKFEGVMKLILGAFRLAEVTPPSRAAGGGSPLVTLEVDSCTYELLGVRFPQPPMSLTLVIADPGSTGEVLWYAGYPPPDPPARAGQAVGVSGLMGALAPRPPAVPSPADPDARS